AMQFDRKAVSNEPPPRSQQPEMQPLGIGRQLNGQAVRLVNTVYSPPSARGPSLLRRPSASSPLQDGLMVNNPVAGGRPLSPHRHSSPMKKLVKQSRSFAPPCPANKSKKSSSKNIGSRWKRMRGWSQSPKANQRTNSVSTPGFGHIKPRIEPQQIG